MPQRGVGLRFVPSPAAADKLLFANICSRLRLVET